jgi:putative Ca2+/H+ antiporter (TMEM165/GDT1 family)
LTVVTIFVIAFGLIFTAELGDKTQLMVFTLAMRYGGRSVFAGAFFAFAILSGSAAIVGRGLGELLSPVLITRVSAWVFILFGLFLLMRKSGDEITEQVKPSARAGFLTAFSLIAISEMGDKTQIATLLGVLLAGRLHTFIPARYITPASGILFILLGIGTLVLA